MVAKVMCIETRLGMVIGNTLSNEPLVRDNSATVAIEKGDVEYYQKHMKERRERDLELLHQRLNDWKEYFRETYKNR